MFLQVKIGTFYFKVKSLDFNLLVKSTKVTRVSQFWSRVGCRCAVWPASVLLPSAMIKWFFDVSSWVFFCCLYDCDVIFLCDDLRNEGSQHDEKSTLPNSFLPSNSIIICIFSLFQDVSEVSIAGKCISC